MHNTALNRFRYDPDLPRLAVALALVVIAQVLLPKQAHSRMAQTADGWAFEICTWGATADPSDEGRPERSSAALWFSLLAADLTAGWLQPPVVNADLTAAPRDCLPATRRLSTTTVANAIRAPPFA